MFTTRLALAGAATLALGTPAPVVAAPSGPTPVEVVAIRLINAARAQGVRCPGGGGGAAVAPLVYQGTLRAVAYAHAANMGAGGYLSHYEGGAGPKSRVVRAGYRASRLSEIIYKHSLVGNRAEAAVSWWLSSPVHCRAIMNPAYREIGVGYSSVGRAWTAILALPQ